MTTATFPPALLSIFGGDGSTPAPAPTPPAQTQPSQAPCPSPSTPDQTSLASLFLADLFDAPVAPVAPTSPVYDAPAPLALFEAAPTATPASSLASTPEHAPLPSPDDPFYPAPPLHLNSSPSFYPQPWQAAPNPAPVHSSLDWQLLSQPLGRASGDNAYANTAATVGAEGNAAISVAGNAAVNASSPAPVAVSTPRNDACFSDVSGRSDLEFVAADFGPALAQVQPQYTRHDSQYMPQKHCAISSTSRPSRPSRPSRTSRRRPRPTRETSVSAKIPTTSAPASASISGPVGAAGAGKRTRTPLSVDLKVGMTYEGKVITKAELRRIKNRESSARSYYNRRARVEALEAELEATKVRAASLLKRELALRKENSSLKRERVAAYGAGALAF